MSKIKNGGLDQYGAEPFEQQQFGTAGDEGVKNPVPVASYGGSTFLSELVTCAVQTLSGNGRL